MEVGVRATTATRRGHVAHGSGRCSTLGGDSGSSSEEGGGAEGEEEDEEEEEGVGGSGVSRAEEGVSRCSSTVASDDACGGAGSDGGGGAAAQATGSHAKPPSSVDSGWRKRGSRSSSGIAGKGGAKKSGVGAMFRRRLRSVRGSQASVMLEAAAAVSVAEGREAAVRMLPEGEEATAAEGAGNDGVVVDDPARAAVRGSSRVAVVSKGVAEAGAMFLRDRDDRGHSSSSSSSPSSSSAASPSSRRPRQPPAEVVMRTPVGIRLGRRRRSREGNVEGGERDDGGADAGALVDGGIAGVGVGVGRGDGRGDGGSSP